ncbi:MAG TPA: tRNA preQ1(34) S-adenosylmethionine ribosyltransferase-isomerase QueA [Dehalococcoidia bacterium]|nr:tRNA preQ1(34) S-adenosylmethionine ribosyltransferase-isomerase QueA [Dehalococcoidia bacterium]
MKTSDFEYVLPQELIAQTPIADREQSRLMIMDRNDGSLQHRKFFEVTDFLHDGDVLVINDSRVIPARVRGRRAATGGKIEILLLRRLHPGVWETLVKPAKRIRAGETIELTGGSPDTPGPDRSAEVVGAGERGMRIIRFADESLIARLGQVALPPYIHVPLADSERYQTVYAADDGSVAAPTAGLHFTPGLLAAVREKGVKCLSVTLHIGLDTFRPVQEEDPEEHIIHTEYGVLSREVADELSLARREGRRVICVGTTSVRLVEAATRASSPLHVKPFEGWVDLFILPGYEFQMVDAMITNFHLPRSTLLMLVSAFAGDGLIMKGYREAVNLKYRFYSFGDAMLIL